MKIEKIKKDKSQTIESIHDGEVFVVCSNPWIATSEYCDFEATHAKRRKCVRLTDGHVDEFALSMKVGPVTAKVVIE